MTKNKKINYLFFLCISLCSIINAGNSNLYIQINFILVSSIFLYTLSDKNYVSHLKFFFIKSKISIFFFLLFISYLIFQIIPLPLEILKIFSSEKYFLLNQMNYTKGYSTINLSPTNGYFQIINYFSIFIFILLIKMIFYKQDHIYRFYYFLAFLGAMHSIFAVLLYLNGNPNFFFIEKLFYKNASTGFMVNRTVFSIFLLICLISALEYLKNVDLRIFNKKRDNFFNKIYIRIFILFITIGIITTFSRLGNFLMILTISLYFAESCIIKKNSNKTFSLILVFIITLDVLVFGYFFGGEKILSRYLFLSEELNVETYSSGITRLKIILFSLSKTNNFLLFGYGAGGYENLFKLNYLNTSLYANHAHSDIVEFFGEFGIVGFILFVLSFYNFIINKKNYNFKLIVLILIIFTILIFDFSLHIPLIQICMISILLTNLLNKKI